MFSRGVATHPTGVMKSVADVITPHPLTPPVSDDKDIHNAGVIMQCIRVMGIGP